MAKPDPELEFSGTTAPLLTPEPAAGSYLSPNVLTGAAALALAAYWCYMNQDELCASLLGYDSTCSSGWSWGGGL